MLHYPATRDKIELDNHIGWCLTLSYQTGFGCLLAWFSMSAFRASSRLP